MHVWRMWFKYRAFTGGMKEGCIDILAPSGEAALATLSERFSGCIVTQYVQLADQARILQMNGRSAR